MEIKKPDLLPVRTIIYGSDKVGKSSFAASAPNPLFLDLEGGLGELAVDCVDLRSQDFSAVMLVMAEIYKDSRGYKTLVIDSLDWLESKIFASVCLANKVKNIEEIGYAKGYIFALNFWHQFIQGLDAIRSQCGMEIICIAHAQIVHVDDPAQVPYDKWGLKLHKKAHALFCEWADAILFASYETYTRQVGESFNQKINRAYSAGNRVIFCEERPSFDAGNRFGLPEKLELSYSAYAAAIAQSRANKTQKGE